MAPQYTVSFAPSALPDGVMDEPVAHGTRERSAVSMPGVGMVRDAQRYASRRRPRERTQCVVDDALLRLSRED